MSYAKKVMEAYKGLTVPVYAVPRTLQQTIPIYKIAEDGIFLLEKKKASENKRFDKAYLFWDTNYSTKDEMEREEFLKLYCQFLNSLNVSFKIVIMNSSRNMERIRNDVFIRNEDSDFMPLVDDINQNIHNGIKKGRNGIEQKKLFILTCERQSVEHARDYFRTIEANLKSNFSRMESGLVPLDAKERLRCLHSFYRFGKEEEFTFDLQELREKKADWRDAICGLSIRQHKNEAGKYDGKTLEYDDRYVRVLFARDLPNSMTDEFIKIVTSVSFPTITTLDVAPVPPEVARKRLLDLYMENGRSIEKQQEQRNRARAYASDITYDKRKEKDEIETYLDVMDNDEKLFYMGLYITVTAGSMEELESNVLSICTTALNYSVILEPALYNQINALNTSLPVGARFLNAMRPLFTQPLCAFVPFNVQELYDKNGIYYGINQISKNIIVGNRKRLTNPHGFILGTTGGGKGYETKNELVQVVLGTKDDVIVVDPQNEYKGIAEALKGEFIDISAVSGNYLNPLDAGTRKHFESKEGFIADKTELMLGIAEQILKQEITMGQKSIVGRCVGLVYRAYFARIEANKRSFSRPPSPTMQEFYEIMKAQEEDAAKDLKLGFELFVEGALNIFSKPTNVDVNRRFVVFGINDLGRDLSPVGQLIMLENIRARIAENYRKGKATWLYIDEFHHLVSQPFSLAYLEKIWKEVRKLGGICTGITQNITDLLRTKEVETMLCNSEYVSLLNQSEMELPLLANALGLNQNLLEFVRGAKKGSGLIKFGTKYIPKSNTIPKDTPLYNLFNTDFYELHGTPQKPDRKAWKQAVRALPAERKAASLAGMDKSVTGEEEVTADGNQEIKCRR